MIWLAISAWVLAIAASGYYLVRILMGLAAKGQALSVAAQPLIKQLVDLAVASEVKPEYTPAPDNLQDPLAGHVKAVAEMAKRRERKAEERQRRLVARLKQLTTGEKQ